MKFLKFLFVGIMFGFTATKSEIISWYRINEMFHFEDFHMYGVIGSAVIIGALIVFWIKRFRISSLMGQPITFDSKHKGFTRYFLGGSIFGLGWAMTGACPGPIYTLIGNGYLVFLMVLVMAMLGTFAYGVVKSRLPH